MRNTYSGSAILTVVLLSSILVILATTIIRNATNITDIAIQREKYEKNYYAFLGLLNYSESLVFFYKKELGKIKKKLQIELISWQAGAYTGVITCLPKKKIILVTVQLLQAHTILQSRTYSLAKA